MLHPTRVWLWALLILLGWQFQGREVICGVTQGRGYQAQAALICSPVVPPSQEPSLIQNTPGIFSKKMQQLLQKLLRV